MKVTKAIIAVAGYGTRRLPITKAIEKCMLPLLNRPVVDYIVTDCIRAGVTDIYFVISDGAPQLKKYYSCVPELETYLKQNSKTDLLASIQPPKGIKFHFVEQEQRSGRYGTTIPVWLCRDLIDPNDPIIVVMGDQCIYRPDGGSDLIDLLEKIDSNNEAAGMLAVEVAQELLSQYGILALDNNDNFSHIVDKPLPEEAPSNLNNAGVYVLPGSIWEFIERDVRRDHLGEYMITDVINDFVAAGHTMVVHRAKGKYLDCGSLKSWVEANTFLLTNKST